MVKAVIRNKKKKKNMEKVKRELEEIKATLKETLMNLTSEINELKEEIKTKNITLEEIIKTKDNRINELERRVEDLEQYTRVEDVMITGLATKHRSYARVVAQEGGTGGGKVSGSVGGQLDPPEELQTLERQVVEFFESRGMSIRSDSIAACHVISRKVISKKLPKPATPVIVMRFANRKYKMELMKQGYLLKGTGVYINDHLTKKNADIAWQARMLKKAKKIQATWIRNCKIMIKLNGTPEESKVMEIKDIKELDKYRE